MAKSSKPFNVKINGRYVRFATREEAYTFANNYFRKTGIVLGIVNDNGRR